MKRAYVDVEKFLNVLAQVCDDCVSDETRDAIVGSMIEWVVERAGPALMEVDDACDET